MAKREKTKHPAWNCLRKVRRDQEESQDQLALAVGCSRGTIDNIERFWAKNCSDELMLKIADHYGKPVGDIFFTPLVRHFVQDVNQAETAEEGA